VSGFQEDLNGVVETRLLRTFKAARERIVNDADTMESLRDNFKASRRSEDQVQRFRL